MKTTGLSTGSDPYSCKVRLLRDEESVVVKFQKQVTGEWLLDYVCQELNIIEKWYFGLRFTDQQSRRQWLDLTKPLLKQVKDPLRDSICFRVRYYPASPESLREELTRYQLYMQLRRDAFHGRLVPRPSDLPQLCALIIQSELGDYDDVELDPGFTKDIDLLPKLANSMEDKITEAYKQLCGLTPADTEVKFIDRVKSLETYGIDPQASKDKATEEAIHVGANYAGISVFANFRRIKLLKWEHYVKCGIDGKVVSIGMLYPELDDKHRKQTFKYKCSDEHTAKYLWTNILDQHAFFNLSSHDQAKPVKSGGLFKRGSTFRFSGRVYGEVVSDSNKITRMAPDFIRASSLSLNRSLSIRSTSSRRLAPPSNRYSMGAIPHSQSLPIDFNGLNESGDMPTEATTSLNVSEGRIEEMNTPPDTPTDENGTQSEDDEQQADNVLTQTRYDETDLSHVTGVDDESESGSYTDDYSETTDSVLSTPVRLPPVTEEPITPTQKTSAPLYSSTPVTFTTVLKSPLTNHHSDVAPELTPVLHTHTHPDCATEEIPVSPTETVSLSHSVGPSRFPPEIIITEEDEESHPLESANPIKPSREDIPITASTENTPAKPPRVTKPPESVVTEFVQSAPDRSGRGDQPSIQAEIVEEEVHVQFAEPVSTEIIEQDMTLPDSSDPLSESTREKLKLPLHRLDDMSESSAEPTPASSSRKSASKPDTPSLINTFLITLLVTGGVLLLLAVLLFETDLIQTDIEVINQIELAYYKPIRDSLSNLLSGNKPALRTAKTSGNK